MAFLWPDTQVSEAQGKAEEKDGGDSAHVPQGGMLHSWVRLKLLFSVIEIRGWFVPAVRGVLTLCVHLSHGIGLDEIR